MRIDIEEVGIKYKKIKIADNKYVLIPIGLLDGYSVGDIYYSDKEYKIATDIEILKNEKILIDSIKSIKDLISIYEYDDIEFLRDYYLQEEKDYIIYMEVNNNEIIRKKINLNLIKKSSKETYEINDGEEKIILNAESIKKLLDIDNIKNIKIELEKLKKKLNVLKEAESKKVTKLIIENGKVKEIYTEGKVTDIDKKDTKPSILIANNNITLKGLENYIKERVFGHDKEIKMIAKTLMMNYTAIGNERREPLLLIGLTGTGKTETIRAAAEYLKLPFVEINTINLVPQGIKGESLEDCLFSLISQSNYDISLAEKGIAYFDEFDKLGMSASDYKTSIKDILLKFIEGGMFTIEGKQDTYSFNTKNLSKVFTGVFEEIYKKNYKLGFYSYEEDKKNTDIRNQIINKNYYGKELLTRIKYVYMFDELSNDTKRRILLESKLSEFLLKKERYKRQFGIDLITDDSYIDGILEVLNNEDKSIRDLNNLVSSTLEEIEYELLSKAYDGGKINLTKDIIEDNTKFVIKK